MAAYRPLDAPTIARELSRLDGWTLSSDGRCITKTFMFASFPAAFAFMSECAQAAERLNHHPDWSNSYTRVEVSLTTHVKKQLTDRDFELAAAMEEAFARGV